MTSSRFNLGSTSKTLNLSLFRFNERSMSENLALHKLRSTYLGFFFFFFFFFDGNLPRLVCELGSRIVNFFVVFQPKYSLGLIPMSGRAINHLQSHCFTFNLNQLNTTQHFESNPNFTASHRMSSSCTILPKARNSLSMKR